MPSFKLLDITYGFDQLVALLAVAAVVGAVVLRLKQPLIISFIAVGIMVGPSGFGWVTTSEPIRLLAQIGLALLLFVVGLKLDLKLIRTMGPVALASGLGQVLFTSIGGFFLSRLLGMDTITSVYVAVALTFSSTIIIVKLLSDKRETDSLHGKIAVGFLIVQDIVVVLVMIGLSAYAGSQNANIGLEVLFIVIKGAVMLGIIAFVSVYVFPLVLSNLARSSELFVLFAIAWAVFLAGVSNNLGFSKEVGAFLAGISLASTEFREILGARLVTLRDFLLLFFFIDLGTQLEMRQLGEQVWAAIPLSVFVLVGNPFIVMCILGFMGYRKRTGFLAGLTVAQISEFSLILIAMGFGMGHINESAVGLVTLVGLITIGLSTYMILYSHQLYARISPFLGIFERKVTFREQAEDTSLPAGSSADIIMFGLGRYGTGMGMRLSGRDRSVLGVDFDPQAVAAWKNNGGRACFGDAEDPEFPGMLPLSTAKWVISAIPNQETNITLIESLKNHGFRGLVAAPAQTETEAEELESRGADLVFLPNSDAAAEAVDVVFRQESEELRRKMDRYIESLNDHFIVCGFGRMGKRIVQDFLLKGLPFVVVESNPEQIPILIEQNIPFVEGKASEDEVLLKAGIDRAKGLISVAATEEENVFIVLTARGLNRRLYIVARSIQVENEDKLKRAGADKVISPYILGGERMAAAVMRPRITDFLDVMVHGESEGVEIADLMVSGSCWVAGKSIKDAQIRQNCGVTILAVRRAEGDFQANPEPDFIIQPGDELIVVGSAQQVDKAEELLCSGSSSG